MISILIAAIVGFITHKKFKPISDCFPAGWNTISDYSMGGVLIIAIFPLFYLFEMRDMPHGFKRAVISLVLDFFGVGAGTVAGWLSDTDALTTFSEK